jgi:hypothetical protein
MKMMRANFSNPVLGKTTPNSPKIVSLTITFQATGYWSLAAGIFLEVGNLLPETRSQKPEAENL